MKVLIYKTNPKIRITAPEIKSYREFYTLSDKDSHYLFKMEDWTLVEEEPEKIREIRACIGYALACIPNEKIKDFGVSLQDCLNYIAPVDKGLRESEKQTSEYFKEPDYDKQVVEKMSKELAKIITDQIAEPVDLEKLALEKYPIQVSYLEGFEKGYELGLNTRNDEQGKQEVYLEEFTEKMDAWKARFNHPDDIPIKATMAFTARMFYQYPNVARQWYEQLPKATID